MEVSKENAEKILKTMTDDFGNNSDSVKSRLKIHDMRRCPSHPRVKLKFKKQIRKFEKEEKMLVW